MTLERPSKFIIGAFFALWVTLAPLSYAETVVLDNLDWGDNVSSFADSVYVNSQSIAHGVCFTPSETIIANKAYFFLWTESEIVTPGDVTVAIYKVELPASCFGDTGNIPLTSATLKVAGNPEYTIARGTIDEETALNTLIFDTNVLFNASSSYMMIIESELASTTQHLYTKRWSGTPEIGTNIKVTAGDTNANNFAKQASPRIYFPFRLVYDSSLYTGTLLDSSATVPINKNIEIIKPTYGTTTASTTISIEINYKTAFSIDSRPTTTRYFQITDALTGDIEYEYEKIIPPNSSENITISTTTTLGTGSKYVRAMYLTEAGTAYSEVDEVFFNVVENTYLQATGITSPRASTTALTQIDCNTFDIGCQLQKALVFLFVPSGTVLNKFSSLWTTIKEKRPFGYVTITINQLQSLNVSGSSAFNLGTVPFMESLFTPFRTLLSGILWALYAVYFYQRRLINLDI